MTRLGRVTRGFAVLGLSVPLSGAALLLTAAPALAGGTISNPVDGAVFETGAPIPVRANITGTANVDMTLQGPADGSPAVVVKSGKGTLTNNNATLDYSFDANCYTGCASGLVAYNGTWTIRLSGGATDASTFKLRQPPAAPAALSARADGYRAVVLSWPKGAEPDLTGWTVYGDNRVVQDSVGTDACSGGSCSTTVTYPADGSGGHTYSIVAHRKAAADSTETLASEQSPQATVSLGAPPQSTSASPGPDSGSGGTGGQRAGSTGSNGTTGGTSSSTGGGTASSPSGGSSASPGPSPAIGASKAPETVAERRAFALTFKAFAPKLGIPKLPPLPNAQPAVAPLPDGTFQKTLGYKDVVKQDKIDSPQAAARRVTGVVGSALDSAQFLRSIAGALVLLLLAAHLRRWLGSHTPE